VHAVFGVELFKVFQGLAVKPPAEPALILPEVKDPRLWFGGQFPWWDPEHTIIRFFGQADVFLAINTAMVKPGEVTSYKDLLDPRWKGKILFKSRKVNRKFWIVIT
jgi:ABC-type Fe3+ transport system substrate-binding protein